MDVEEKPNPSMAKTHFEHLAITLGASGNYAFKVEGTSIYAAFEGDADAVRFCGHVIALLHSFHTGRRRRVMNLDVVQAASHHFLANC